MAFQAAQVKFTAMLQVTKMMRRHLCEGWRQDLDGLAMWGIGSSAAQAGVIEALLRITCPCGEWES